MTPAEIKKLRLDLGRTQEGMAKILTVSINTIKQWESGRATPQPVFRAKLAKLHAYINGKARG